MVFHSARGSFVALAVFLTTAGSAAAQSQNTGKDLKVRIVIQTATNTYSPVNVPVHTVVSVLPVSGTIIRCPSLAGLAWVLTTGDCFENTVAPTTTIKLTAPTSIPNATFLKWTDIPPGTMGLPISNFCIWSNFNPNIQCTMAGARFIQAVYKCNDGYTYDPVAKQCKATTHATLCQKFTPSITACRAAVKVVRKTAGPATYTVTIAPPTLALTPSQNALPSSATSCVNPGSSLLQTNCGYAFNWNPTALTLIATSSTGTLPPGFLWSGACTFPTSQTASNPVCLLTIVPNPGNTNTATANFP